MVMAAYFLLLYGGVGFIQDKRFFGSAHKDVLLLSPIKSGEIPRRAYRWRGNNSGFVSAVCGRSCSERLGRSEEWFQLLGILRQVHCGALCHGDLRYLFFDWCLLCHSNFFPYFYPEIKGIVGPHMFGYNKKQHSLHFLIYIPACAIAAWICTLLH